MDRCAARHDRRPSGTDGGAPDARGAAGKAVLARRRGRGALFVRGKIEADGQAGNHFYRRGAARLAAGGNRGESAGIYSGGAINGDTGGATWRGAAGVWSAAKIEPGACGYLWRGDCVG